ncbi:hypothetical protein FQA47_008316 [Oryzias melastigma]|uniref:Uncharacterized protein n=1 Tax=Oryzias melastigma TaxID=30732 RepID=A0A834CEV5_ORYME|nr:hypothetical protein FQA47_008316 [Oryzias melastigma]
MLHLQEELLQDWHAATITDCSPAWSMCVDCSPDQYVKETQAEASQCFNFEKAAAEITGDLNGDLQLEISKFPSTAGSNIQSKCCTNTSAGANGSSNLSGTVHQSARVRHPTDSSDLRIKLISTLNPRPKNMI